MQDVKLLKTSERPRIIGVGGLTSEVGKTTLLCELLRAFPEWEAIKTTRGHYPFMRKRFAGLLRQSSA